MLRLGVTALLARGVQHATLVGCLIIFSACAVEFVQVPHPAEVKPWEKIAIRTDGETPFEGRLLFADGNTLYVLRDWQWVHVKGVVILSSRVTEALRAVGAQWPAVFDGQSAWSSDRVTVSRDAIIEDGRKIAALTDLVARVRPTEDVSVGQYKITPMALVATAITLSIIVGLPLLISR